MEDVHPLQPANSIVVTGKSYCRVSAADARTIIAQRRTARDDVEAVAACAQDMDTFLTESELSERRAFITTSVREIAVKPGGAQVRYNVAIPADGPIPGTNSEEIPLDGLVLSAR